MTHRVAIATRIFEPEPSAASFRLDALATALTERGKQVSVLTVLPPKQLRQSTATHRGFRVSRFPVLRDRTGYVRGYFQYLSFDVPLLARILCGKSQDAIVVEPPPTTWVFASIAARLRRTPLITYAADIWSDASETTGAPNIVVKTVRAFERWAFRRSAVVLAVNDGVADRVRAICSSASVRVVGNGIDTQVFSPTVEPVSVAEADAPYFIYTGTASEWQGAEVFIHALAQVRAQGVDARMVFLGHGTAREELKTLADSLGAPVEFMPTVPPERAAQWIRGAVAGLASIRPGAGYDFAFPTKLYAAWATGTPTIYAGPGPVRDVLTEHPVLGIGTEHDAELVAHAMVQVLDRDAEASRNTIAAWATDNVSLHTVAQRASAIIDEVLLNG